MSRPARRRGPSVRLQLTLSYAGLVLLAGALLLAVVWLFLLRYVPDQAVTTPYDDPRAPYLFIPGRSDLWTAFWPKAAAVLGFLLVCGLGGGWLLAGRILAPLGRITEATRRAAGGSLSHRIGLRGRDDEFRELADAFDGMLARLEAHLAEQQRFAANASHELRTPLTITQTLLELARKDPTRDRTRLVESLYAVNTRTIELTEALLVLSRADRRSFPREEVDLSLVAEEAAETLLPLAEERGVVLETAGELAVTQGEPALLLQLATNLAHNAIVHNLPEGGSVRITTRHEPAAAVLSVVNTGPHLDPDLVDTLTEPFQRGRARTQQAHAGVGLGLAIARSITEAHDGTLALAALPTGGLLATVRLPTARPATG
ncbi:sensor histidine kinase [Nocardioides nitrophenolicus]|uniref:sensor histidine kinase n=1 Tax=Nocardioides nitrophenolicus TaxID=60489 RepID=UPI001958649A|nr:HAMP domain-containing sensor histidine kinase [Nocardioides nitrophenolicus]MBM7518780.1 two-component system sensor histidine kinase VanS [Nocardioides nitrophenolicus]